MRILEFTLDAPARAAVQSLALKTGAASVLELIRNALRFYSWYLRNVRDEGAKLIIRNNVGQEVEIVFADESLVQVYQSLDDKNIMEHHITGVSKMHNNITIARRAIGGFFGFWVILVLSVGALQLWLAGSLATSAIKAATGSCGTTYGIERATPVSGDWFCPASSGLQE